MVVAALLLQTKDPTDLALRHRVPDVAHDKHIQRYAGLFHHSDDVWLWKNFWITIPILVSDENRGGRIFSTHFKVADVRRIDHKWQGAVAIFKCAVWAKLVLVAVVEGRELTRVAAQAGPVLWQELGKMLRSPSIPKPDDTKLVSLLPGADFSFHQLSVNSGEHVG